MGSYGHWSEPRFVLVPRADAFAYLQRVWLAGSAARHPDFTHRFRILQPGSC